MTPPLNSPLMNQGQAIYYQGPDLSEGPLPAVLYFALSGTASLYEDPFNQPVQALRQESIRFFSWDLPFHEAQADYKEAMQKWAEEALNNPSFFPSFIQQCQSHLRFLISSGYVDPQRIGAAGLSRGGFIATLLAASDPQISAVLGFAPITHLKILEKYLPESAHLTFKLQDEMDSLINKKIRFYMGNRDVRVETSLCFEFIRTLADHAYHKGIRSPSAEMIIYPSIGHQGHGTPPFIFQSGAAWIKEQLLH
jgi:dienelactone hydrolase